MATISGRCLFYIDFLGGISWSFGVWIGTSIILLLTFLIASKVDFVPIIGNFVAEITKYVAVHNSPFHF
jgi:hypothetical protein